MGKHPRTLNGVIDATTDRAKILQWWERWPDANIGIATGAGSGFVVVDIDPRHGGNESLKNLLARYGPFPEKVWAQTGGGGWHLLFKHPGVRVGNIQSTPDRPGKLGPGLDVRGDGGYIVVSPSVHASGNRYTWGVEISSELPDLPDWLKSILASPEPARTAGDVVDGDIPGGQRNMTLASFAGTMRRRAMSPQAILAALRAENEARCHPPLADDEVCRIAQSVSRYDPQDPVQVSVDVESGIYEVGDLSDAIDDLYEQGLTGGTSTGWPSLDWYYTVKRGQWTVVSGIPSHGKTAVLDALMVNLAMTHGWRFCVCSPENQPLARHASQLMALWAGEPFGKGSIERMTSATRDRAKKWLGEHFTFILPAEDDCTITGILDLVSTVNARREVAGIVIDPWNELEHRRPAQMNETEYVSQSLTKLRRFARSNDLHLWLVAHPTKLLKDKDGSYPVPTLYDVSGSANFRNKADMGLVIWRDVANENSATEVHVQKVRFRECGKIGKCELYFDRVTGRFNESSTSGRGGFHYSDQAEREAQAKF